MAAASTWCEPVPPPVTTGPPRRAATGRTNSSLRTLLPPQALEVRSSRWAHSPSSSCSTGVGSPSARGVKGTRSPRRGSRSNRARPITRPGPAGSPAAGVHAALGVEQATDPAPQLEEAGVGPGQDAPGRVGRGLVGDVAVVEHAIGQATHDRPDPLDLAGIAL